jgi:transcriptional regulator with GAF, ATPase, and Fis domain
LTAALAASGGNKAAAARALGLTRNGLHYKLERLGLVPARRR